MTFRKHVVSYIALLTAGGLLIAGCGGKSSPTKPVTPPSPPPPPAPVLASIMVTPTLASMVVGGTQRFTASARGSDGSNFSGVSISWSSSNTAVVTINTSGVATAVSAGTSMIRAMGNGISSNQVTVTVTAPPPSPPVVATVMVNPSEATVEEGQTQQFEAMAATEDGMVIPGVEFTWSSSEDGVATVSTTGLAMGVSTGEVQITATVDGESGMATLTVTERPPPRPPVVASVSVSPPMASIEEGGMQQFAAMAMTEEGVVIPGAMFTWMSSDDGIATIDTEGLATGVSAGEVTVTAMTDDISGTATLTVMKPPPEVATVTVTPSMAEIEEGRTQQFIAVAEEADGMQIADAMIVWSSSDENVATVNTTGLATGVGPGEATITATSDCVSGDAALTVTEPPPPPPPVVASVSVSPPMASIEEGGMQQFEAMAMTEEGVVIPGAMFTWMSSDDGIATIDTEGLAMGVSAGEVTVTAMTDGISGTATLTVMEPPPEVATVTVTPSMAEIEEGQTQQFIAVAAEADGMLIANVTISWSSSDENVATVNTTGLATGVGPGEATITATSDGVSGDAALTVTEPPPPPPPVVASVSVSPPMAEIEEGGMQQFEAMAMTEEGMVIPNVVFTWMSSDDGIATIDTEGLAMGVSAGEVTVTAMTDDISGTATLTVLEPPPVVATVTLTPSMAEIEEGRTQQFIAVAAEADGMLIADATFIWSSSHENVATVSSTGLATGVGPGEATITATSDGVSGDAALTVTEAPPVLAKIEVSPSMAEIEEGQMLEFTAKALTSDNEEIPDVSFNWSSSNTNVATVGADGLATAVNAGTASIRAMAEGITGSGSLTVTAPPPASRSGMFPGATAYRAMGTATLEETGSGGLVLRFGSDFSIVGAGYDVILYTEGRIKLRGNDAAPAGSYVNLGDMKSRTGAQEYPVPSGVALDSYDFVIIFCHAFNITVGAAELQQ